jgi:YaiO family outer membrane protein
LKPSPASAVIKIVYTLLLTLLPLAAFAQQTTTADGLFQQARTAAFEHRNYPTAITLAKQALDQAPDYTDVAVFLGRLYTWNKNLPEARAVFAGLEEKQIRTEDFYLAYASLEYWNKEENRALQILDKGLALNPESEPLWLLKAKIYNSMDRYKEAEEAVARLLIINPSHTEGRELLVRLNDVSSRNAVGITYGYTHFDKQFDDDWHMLGLSYKRVTPIGSVILKGNLANKFGETGTQIELEAYPRISGMFYLYVGGAYSNDVGIFPKYRTGVSLNANLPKSFEAEIGYRQLYFTESIMMYTASVGKYYKNYWFNVRTYLTPQSDQIAQSYTGTVRYYIKGAQDFIGFQIGSGISPEENRSNLLQQDSFKLKTIKMGAEYQFSVKQTNVFSLSTMYYNQEYQPGQRGNQFDLTFGYTKKF